MPSELANLIIIYSRIYGSLDDKSHLLPILKRRARRLHCQINKEFRKMKRGENA